jgi:hypothetical protein
VSTNATWYVIKKRLEELEKGYTNSLINQREYREIVRAQEAVRVVKTLLAMEDEFTKKE